MRLLLDAQFSGRVVGRHLRSQGHDVVALNEHREFEGIDDAEVLTLATEDGRLLVTHNVHDFPDILREWAEAGHEHAGCVIVVGIGLDQFGLLIRSIEAAIERVPRQEDWLNRSMHVGRSAAIPSNK